MVYFNAQTIGLLIVGIINLFLGALVYLREKSNSANVFFALIALFVSGWAFSRAFFEIYSIDSGLIYLWIDALYVNAALIPLFFLFFSYTFPENKISISKKFVFLVSTPTLAVISFVLIPGFVIADVWQNPEGYKSIAFGAGYVFYNIYLLSYFLWGFINIIKKYFKSAGIVKVQLKYIFWGTFTATLFGVSTNLILPIFGSFRFFWLGPVATVIMVVFITYAIIKHQLLNIKVIATELLTFIIWIIIFIEVFLAENWLERLLEIGILILIIMFGILIIRSVWKEVKQREEMEKLALELKAANAKLVALDELKTGIFSFVSHQIKAPIGIVKGFAQLIYDGSYGRIPEKVKERVGDIKKSCDRLIRLVEDFLDLRKIEEGRMDYQFKETNIADLIKSVVEEVGFLAEQKKLSLDFENKTERDAVAAVDEQRMRQVIMNLVENAIKYTQNGFVKIRLENGDDYILISVSDSGMGMAKEVLPTIFNQFKRAQAARTIKGTGLGLYIARQIVEAHKGKIWAGSEGEGKGSGFFVKLPKNGNH